MKSYDDEYWLKEDRSMDWQQKGFWFLCGFLIAVVTCAAVGLMIP